MNGQMLAMLDNHDFETEIHGGEVKRFRLTASGKRIRRDNYRLARRNKMKVRKIWTDGSSKNLG